MLYYHCSGSLQFLPPPNHLSTSLQEFIKLERSHETSFRAWNQDFLAANVAMNSWALSESTNDRETLETLTQITKLLSKTISAQNQYATALADYRANLKETLQKETELGIIKKDREILLKRFLKLNRRAPITPSNNLNFRIKLDDAKRELAICQRTLRTTADELHESKQTCLREALRAKLAKYEDLGQAIKLNAQQAIQLLDRTIPDHASSETESDFKSCDQDSLDEPTLLTPPLINDNHHSWPVRHGKRAEEPNPLDIKTFRHTSAQGSQQRDHPMDRPSTSNHPAGLHIYSGTRQPNHSKQPIVPGTALMPPPRVLVRKRDSVQSRQAHSRSHARHQQPSPPPNNPSRNRRSEIQPRLSRSHNRQRSQSLDLRRSSNTLPRETFKARKLKRAVSHRLRSSRITSNPSTVRSLGHLPSSNRPPLPNDSVSSFKFFPKSVISKLGGMKRRKDEKRRPGYIKNQPSIDGKSAEVQSLQASQERSFWPTIQPLSLYSDTGSEDSLSEEEEERGDRYPLEDGVMGGLEYPIRSGRNVRGTWGGGGNQDTSSERLPKNNHQAKTVRRHSRSTSWNQIPRRTSQVPRIRRVRGGGSRKVRSTTLSVSDQEDDSSSDSVSSDDRPNLDEDLTTHMMVNDPLLLQEGPFSSTSNNNNIRSLEHEKTLQLLSRNSPLSRIKEYDGSSTSDNNPLSLRKLPPSSSSPFTLHPHPPHHQQVETSSSKEEPDDVEEKRSFLDHHHHPSSNDHRQGKIDEKFHIHDDKEQVDQHDGHANGNGDGDRGGNGRLLSTHKAMGDIKAKFFALGMIPNSSSS